MAQFNHFELSLLNPSFDSPLVDALTELELLRHLWLDTDVHPILIGESDHRQLIKLKDNIRRRLLKSFGQTTPVEQAAGALACF